MLGPLVETLVQASIRDFNLQVHFFLDYEDPRNRRSPKREVDFVPERVDGTTLPVEVKFRKKIDPEDALGVKTFRSRFECPLGVIVTRETSRWDRQSQILYIPLQNFLLAF